MVKKVIKITGYVLAGLLCLAGLFLGLTLWWVDKTWPHLSLDELVYTVTADLGGTDLGMVRSFVLSTILPTVLAAVLFLLLYYWLKKHRKLRSLLLALALAAPLLFGAAFTFYMYNKLEVKAYFTARTANSGFIDEHYTDPGQTEITWPAQKRNLIYIYLESLETSYSDVKNGGAFPDNYLPNLTRVAQENEDFSGPDSALNGGHALTGGTWTMGAMFSQTAGLPLNISIDGNAMGSQEHFFKDAVTLGDLLAEQGYDQTLMIGSDAAFGGRKLYFTDHGNYRIVDYNTAREQGWIPADYRVWWGYEDTKLFEFAKQQLTAQAAQARPFNFTLLTVDTHAEDGYVCAECGNEYGTDQYANVIACSDRQVSAFLDWIRQQDFYENTTVVLVGDHPTMDKNFGEGMKAGYDRRVYTAFVNAAVTADQQRKRTYSTLDMLPTTVAALGAQIKGNRLGLGVNLFAGMMPTLVEQYGVAETSEQLRGQSRLLERLGQIDAAKAEE